jgi:hypothetical protein
MLIVAVGVLKARKLGKADKVTRLLLHAACSALAAADDVRDLVAENVQDVWGLIVYGFVNENFLKQPGSGAYALEVLEVHAAFASFVGTILWWNALADFKDTGCSREKLLSLIFNKVKKSIPSTESAWFRNVSWMILSSVCSSSVLKIRAYSFADDYEKFPPEEERFMQLLQQITNHIKQDVVVEGFQYRLGEKWDLVHREGAQSLSALSRARAAELQDTVFGHVSGLLQDDPSSSANSATGQHVLALGMAILRTAIDMECVDICSEELLPKIMASVLGESRTTESQPASTLLGWWESQVSISQQKYHSTISHLDGMEEYFDTLSEYTLRHHSLALRGGLVDFHLEDVRLRCCEFLSEKDARADKMEVDDFDNSQSNTQARGEEHERTALRLLLKLLAYEQDIEVSSFDLDCVRKYVDSISGSLHDVVHCFQLLCEFAHPSFRQLLFEIHNKMFMTNVVHKFGRIKDTEYSPSDSDQKKKEVRKLSRVQAANENDVVLVCSAFLNAGNYVLSSAPVQICTAVTEMVRACVCTCIFIPVCMYVCMHICLHVCMCTCICVRMCAAV